MSKSDFSKIILGTVQFGLDYGINNSKGKVSKKESQEILKYAYENNIRTLDTAESYGNAHEIIGLFHKNNPENTFKVITKLPKNININFNEKVKNYLKDLNVSQIEVLMFHSFESYYNNIDKLDLLNELKFNNKLKKIGVSVYTNQEINEIIENDQIDVIQVPFNLLDNSNFRKKILIKAKKNGKIIHSRSVLLQGLFFKDFHENNLVVKNLRKELIEISKIASKNNISISKLSINYCLNQEFIDSTLLGVDSIIQLKDNLNSLNYILNEEIINNVNSIKVNNINFLNPSLWT